MRLTILLTAAAVLVQPVLSSIQYGLGITSYSSKVCTPLGVDSGPIVDLASRYLSTRRPKLFHGFWSSAPSGDSSIETLAKYIAKIQKRGYTPLMIHGWGGEEYTPRLLNTVKLFNKLNLSSDNPIYYAAFAEWNLSNKPRDSNVFAATVKRHFDEIKNTSLNRNANFTKIIFTFMNVYSNPNKSQAYTELDSLFNGHYPAGAHIAKADFFGPIFKPILHTNPSFKDLKGSATADQMYSYLKYAFQRHRKPSIIPYSYLKWNTTDEASDTRSEAFFHQMVNRTAEFEKTGLNGWVLSGTFGKVSDGNGLLDDEAGYDRAKQCWKQPFVFSKGGKVFYDLL